MCVVVVDGGSHSVVVDVGGHDVTVVFYVDVVVGAVVLFFWLAIDCPPASTRVTLWLLLFKSQLQPHHHHRQG